VYVRTELFVLYSGTRLFTLHSACVSDTVNTPLRAYQVLGEDNINTNKLPNYVLRNRTVQILFNVLLTVYLDICV
jgi:hypothetical protein